MRKTVSKKKSPLQPSARVVDGKLILSFPNALNPVLWQMDLNDAKASALEVRAADNGEDHVLVLKTAKGEKLEIAPFSGREEAVEALLAASAALENAHGQIRSSKNIANDSGAASGPSVKNRRGKRWLGIILSFLLLFLLVAVLIFSGPRPPQSLNNTNASGSSATTGAAGQAGGSAEQTNGVPMSADEFLNTR